MLNKRASKIFRAINPYRPTIKFIDPQKCKPFSYFNASEGDMLSKDNLTLAHNSIDVPFEIAEHLFSQGYQQAIIDMQQDLDRNYFNKEQI